MKKMFWGIAGLLLSASVCFAAQLADFPIGMEQKEAVAKGVEMKDEKGGTATIEFGGKQWPAAIIFEGGKLAYVMLKGSGSEYMTAADDGMWQLGWLTIYASTDRNIIFDAIKIAASGADDAKIGEAYEKFQEEMQKQKYTKSVSVYISGRVWATFKQTEGNPIEKYPDAVVCNIMTDGNDVNLVFSTFGYMEKMKGGK